MKFQTGGSQIMPVIEENIMHFPKLSFLSRCYSRFSCLQTALMNLGQWEMTKIKAKLPFIFIQQTFDDFIGLGTILILIFPKFNKCYQRIFVSDKIIFWFNDLDYVGFESLIYYSFLSPGN